MVCSLKQQKEIIVLYCDKNLSMAQIGEKMGISSSGVRYYLDKHKVSRRSRSDAITHLYQTKFGRKGYSIKHNLSEKERKLKLAGVMLYWGEGTKVGNTVAFSNSNPLMVKVFLNFLRSICGVDEKRLRAQLYLYSDHKAKDLQKSWSTFLDLPTEQFSKIHMHEKKSGTYTKISKYGTISVQYSDKRLLKTINTWIKEYATKLQV